MMKITIDFENQEIIAHNGESVSTDPLYSKKGFELISQAWLKVGWNEKYPYTFSWFGRPIIQAPEDVVRLQEVIYQVRPNVIIETGVAHGGGLIFYSSLLKAMEVSNPKVIGIDIEIRQHNREAIESHELFPSITLIEGSSTLESTFHKTTEMLEESDRVLVILDSNHSKGHVLEELELYHPLVSKDSYIVATDGSMRDLHDVPRGEAEWVTDNPAEAAEDWVKNNEDFVLETPAWPFNESELDQNITHWPSAWIKRIS